MTRLFWLMVVLSPGMWYVALQPMAVWRQWQKLPAGVADKLQSLFDPANLKPVEDMRWLSGNRFFFNKGTVLVKEGWDYLQYFAPRFYFLAGDGTNFSPSRVEPLPTVLFPFWVMGLLTLLRQRQWRVLVLTLGLGLVAFLSGQKNMAILWPILVAYAYISALGLWRYRQVVWLVVIYGGYILARGIWVR